MRMVRFDYGVSRSLHRWHYVEELCALSIISSRENFCVLVPTTNTVLDHQPCCSTDIWDQPMTQLPNHVYPWSSKVPFFPRKYPIPVHKVREIESG